MVEQKAVQLCAWLSQTAGGFLLDLGFHAAAAQGAHLAPG